MDAMPLYEYECSDCGKRFDRLVAASAADDAACPRCGAAKVRRLISVIAGLGGSAPDPAPQCGQGACGACS
jgi:putative FmdB family regulatory protein